MIKIGEEEFSGSGQVLAGFFQYHKASQMAPEITQSEEDHLYRSASINMTSIRYIIKSRGWRLPTLSTNQVSDLVDRLNSGKAPDFYGLSVRHVKNAGSVAILFLTKYLNLCFQWMEFGVTEEDQVGAASLIFKRKGKSLTNPKSFRKITVCALLGKIKEMAICDFTFPILRPWKALSQFGFTPGLFVKLANIMVTEKRGLALANNLVALHMFLDADSAFDKALHPIILQSMYKSGIEDDIWTYFSEMHSKSQTYVKWSGQSSKDCFLETQGTRQGGVAGPLEYKHYVNPMVTQLEDNCGLDKMGGHPTSVVGLADDIAPTSIGAHPREAIHNLQNLLKIVQDWGEQLHITFGVDKCAD